MILIFNLLQEPPLKLDWHHPDPSRRKIWNKVVEAITSWFCLSNDLRKENDVILEFKDFSIRLEGKSIKYLAPSFRSVISLVFKAYQMAINTTERNFKSSPGITINHPIDKSLLPKPWYRFSFDSNSSLYKQIREGTIFADWKDESINLIQVPTENLTDSIIWFHYSINGETPE